MNREPYEDRPGYTAFCDGCGDYLKGRSADHPLTDGDKDWCGACIEIVGRTPYEVRTLRKENKKLRTLLERCAVGPQTWLISVCPICFRAQIPYKPQLHMEDCELAACLRI